MNKETKKSLTLIVIALCIGIGISAYNSWKLNKCNYEGDAIIYAVDRVKRVSQKKQYLAKKYEMKYKYEVEGKIYKSSENIGDKNAAQLYNIGDSIRIRISCTDPGSTKYIRRKIK